MIKPYIGLTGLQHTEHIEESLKTFRQENLLGRGTHTGMIGFLVSEATAHGAAPQNTRHVLSGSHLRKLAETNSNQTLGMLHCEIDKTPGNKSPFAGWIGKIINDLYRDELLRAIQLNGSAHPDEIKRLKELYPELLIVLQIRKELLACGPENVDKTVQDSRDAISYALIDPSAGTGASFDLRNAVQVFRRLEANHPNLQLGFAGGLHPQNVHERILALRESLGHTNFSIDAESGLRNSKDHYSTQKARLYTQAAARTISAHNNQH